MFLIRIERLTGGHTAQAAFFSSRHAENVILVCRAPPAAHGRRDQVGPFQHFFVGSAFESSHCSRVLHQRVDSRVDEQFIGLVNEEVTHSGLCVFFAVRQEIPFLQLQQRHSTTGSDATAFQTSRQSIDFSFIEQLLQLECSWLQGHVLTEFCTAEEKSWEQPFRKLYSSISLRQELLKVPGIYAFVAAML